MGWGGGSEHLNIEDGRGGVGTTGAGANIEVCVCVCVSVCAAEGVTLVEGYGWFCAYRWRGVSGVGVPFFFANLEAKIGVMSRFSTL